MTKSSERMKHVRLSNAVLKGFRLERLKLRTVQSWQGLIDRLPDSRGLGRGLSMARDTDPDLSTTKPSTTKPSTTKPSKGTQIAFNLLLVRPWVLVIGFWLLSMISAGVALEGLISPRRLTMDEPATSAPTAVADSSAEDTFISVEPSADEIAADPAAETVFGTPPAEARSSNFPTWPLGALVGTCAAGCLVMSRRRAMVRLAAARSRNALRNESRSQLRKVRLSSRPVGSAESVKKPDNRSLVSSADGRSAASKAPASRSAAARSAPTQAATKPPAPKLSRASKRQQRRQRSRQPILPKPVTKSRVLASQAAQSTTPVAHVSRPNPRKRLSFQVANQPSVVTVVPAGEAHPLDWDNGSLAHELDVRPQRSAI